MVYGILVLIVQCLAYAAIENMFFLIFLRTSYRNTIENGMNHHCDMQNKPYTIGPCGLHKNIDYNGETFKSNISVRSVNEMILQVA